METTNFAWQNTRATRQETSSVESDNPVDLFLDSYIARIDQGSDVSLAKSLADSHLVETMSLEKLEELIRDKYPDYQSIEEDAALIRDGAAFILDLYEQEGVSCCSYITELLTSIWDCLFTGFEGVIKAFGIAEFFETADGELHADWKGNKIMMIVSLFALMTSILIPVIGPELAGLIVGGTFLTIMLMSLIYPLFKPLPNKIPPGENWTKLIQEHLLSNPDGREEILDQITQTLTASEDVKHHPMLLGKSGVGKTETLKAFAHAVYSGKYPQLAGKTIYYFNTADLVSSKDFLSSGNTILSRIVKAIGKHRDDAILIFDEIHLACQKREDGAFGDQLKTLLDPGKKGLPPIIGVTTEEEYYRDIFKDHSAFARRFTRISMDNLNDDEVLQIIKKVFFEKAPFIVLEDDAIKYLYEQSREKFPNKPEPLSALTILSQCLQKTVESQKSKTQVAIEELKRQIASLRSSSMCGRCGKGKSFIPYDKKAKLEKIKELQGELADLQDARKEEKSALDHFYRLRKELADMKMQVNRSAGKIAQFAGNTLSTSQQQEAFSFLLTTHFVIPRLEEYLLETAGDLEVKTEINQEMVDEVIREELAMEAKAKEAVEHGKQDITSRAGDSIEDNEVEVVPA
ncbi:MAG: AAA family ATPase [Chlamydiales bacterium]|nr:AAA family ATPase [Chlamydiales bacterium]